MGNLLEKISAKTEKQVNHQQRMVQGKKVKVLAMERDIERLNKISALPVFQENALDNLFLHVSNTVAANTATAQ